MTDGLGLKMTHELDLQWLGSSPALPDFHKKILLTAYLCPNSKNDPTLIRITIWEFYQALRNSCELLRQRK